MIIYLFIFDTLVQTNLHITVTKKEMQNTKQWIIYFLEWLRNDLNLKEIQLSVKAAPNLALGKASHIEKG